MRRVSIFGATGSIGQSTLSLLRAAPEGSYALEAVTGGHNVAQLAHDARAHCAGLAVTAYPDEYQALKDHLSGTGIEAAAGVDALIEAAERPADWVMSAIIGAAGLAPGLAALRQGKILALANKESLVAAGPLLLAEARKHGATILPVDSEHSGIFQALRGEDTETVDTVTLTASGGAFRDWPLDRLATATPAEAANHPNWSMGQRITIDSASMFNKSMEIIETHAFFGFSPEQIDVLIHPESLVHALVRFADGGVIAHLGPPDMRHAIGFALNWPDRVTLPVDRLDLSKVGQLNFSAPDPARYPALRLAYGVIDAGGLAGAAFTAAKETALDAFIAGEIRFTDMVGVVEAVLERHIEGGGAKSPDIGLETIQLTDTLARDAARQIIAKRRNNR